MLWDPHMWSHWVLLGLGMVEGQDFLEEMTYKHLSWVLQKKWELPKWRSGEMKGKFRQTKNGLFKKSYIWWFSVAGADNSKRCWSDMREGWKGKQKSAHKEACGPYERVRTWSWGHQGAAEELSRSTWPFLGVVKPFCKQCGLRDQTTGVM